MKNPERDPMIARSAHPRDRTRLRTRGRVGAADARRPGGLPPAGAADVLGRAVLLRRGPRAVGAPVEDRGLLGWDDPDAGLGSRVPTLSDRLPADLRGAPSGPDFDALPFTSLYLLDDEFAAEMANRTVHSVMHLGWRCGYPRSPCTRASSEKVEQRPRREGFRPRMMPERRHAGVPDGGFCRFPGEQALPLGIDGPGKEHE